MENLKYSFKNTNQEKMDRLKQIYWVLVVKGEKARWWSWRVSPKMPSEKAPEGTEWRRPTDIEIEERERAYKKNPIKFHQMCSKFSRYLRHKSILFLSKDY